MQSKIFFLSKVADERNRATKQNNSNQEATEAVKKELESQMSSLRTENNEKVQDLENRLQVALSKLFINQFPFQPVKTLPFEYSGYHRYRYRS